MIADFGYITILSALIVSILVIAISFTKKLSPKDDFVPMAVTSIFMLTTLAFLSLICAYVVSDFSLQNVYLNSHSNKPLLYKITGVWGNHEGSMLLFLWIFSLYNYVFLLLSSSSQKNEILKYQLVIFASLASFVFFTSNPFETIYPVPENGLGLNPLLQDIGLAIHPPLLYLGYVGFSLSLSFALAGLWSENINKKWAENLYPWVLTSWGFLTLGIFIGSWWAYRELGWGGFWFWDPVENSSLLPWLSGLALLHSLSVFKKRYGLVNWSIFLAILTFSLALVGFFLVRSGILSSVHSFAADPFRGIFMMLLFLFVAGGAFTIFALKLSKIKDGVRFPLVSREGFITINNLLVMVACATILLGTIYPILSDIMLSERVSVGAPYFNIIFNPIVIMILFFAAIGGLAKWKKDNLRRILSQLSVSFILAIITMIALYMHEEKLNVEIVIISLSTWLISINLIQLFKRLRRGLGNIALSFYSMIIAHIGLAVLAGSISFLSLWEGEKELLMGKGDIIKVVDYDIQFAGNKISARENYLTNMGEFSVFKDGNKIADLYPESRIYLSSGKKSTEAAIYSNFTTDIYIVIGSQEEDDKFGVRIFIRPFMNWIWIGATLIALGAFMAAIPRKRKSKI